MNRKAYMRILAISVATWTLVSPAMAQDASRPGASPAATGTSWLDIIVTAQRREERSQDVPIVVTSFSAERLERLNVTQPQDLYGAVPSLVAGTQGQATRDVQSYSIRGQSTGFLASPGVQLYLSEVPVPSSNSLNLQGAPGMFVDLESVQVLSGPQGTLFGRNTTGGAVLFQPRKPVDRFEGYVEGSVGNYDLRALEGAINIPVIPDKLLVRVVGAYQDRRGYTRDYVWNKWRDDTHWYSGRVGITIKPTERLENYLLVYGSKSSNNGTAHFHGGFDIAGVRGSGFCVEGPGSAAVASCDVYRRQTEIANELGPRGVRPGLDLFSKISSWGVINNTAFELTDELTLRNIVSYQKLKDNYASDQDGTPLQQYDNPQYTDLPDFPIAGFTDLFGLPNTPGNVYLNERPGNTLPRDYLEQFTEELQLQGTMLDGRLNFAVGGFYYNATPAGMWGGASLKCSAARTGQADCAPTTSRQGVSNKSKALYAQGTLDLGAVAPALENLRFTAGYRYTWDTINGFAASWSTVPAGSVCGLGTAAGKLVPAGGDPFDLCQFQDTLKYKAPTWTIGLDYKPISNVLVYGKVSRGYKAGGFNNAAARPETTTFLPEHLTTYEMGFKSDWQVGTVPFRLNATYYYSDYKNIQRAGGDANFAISPPSFGAAIFGAEATIQGLEVEASVRLIDAMEIGGTLSHGDGDYTKYEVFSFGNPSCNGAPFGGTADYSCAPFQFLTPWIYNIYTSVDIPIPENMGQLSIFASYSHVSDQYTAPAPFEPGAVIEGYGLLSASVDWKNIGNSGFGLSIFAKNITDKLYRVSNSNAVNTHDVASWLYGEPRTYGLKVKYSF